MTATLANISIRLDRGLIDSKLKRSDLEPRFADRQDGGKKMTFNWEWKNGGRRWLPLCDRVAVRARRATRQVMDCGQVTTHTNLYWTYQAAPGRKAETVETNDVNLGNTP